jgi:hypothetical protein
MTDTTLGWTSYATDTEWMPGAFAGLNQLLQRPVDSRRHRAARRVRKLGRATYATLIMTGLTAIVAVAVGGPGVLLDAADALSAATR